jgi:hypothetical protein
MPKIAIKTREQIAADLTAAIESCLMASGRTIPAIRGEQCPLTAIEGFDSLCGIEVTVDLQTRLGIQLEDNLFVAAETGRPKARTFNEIVESLVNATK